MAAPLLQPMLQPLGESPGQIVIRRAAANSFVMFRHILQACFRDILSSHHPFEKRHDLIRRCGAAIAHEKNRVHLFLHAALPPPTLTLR